MDKSTLFGRAAFKRTAVRVGDNETLYVRELSAAEAKEFQDRTAKPKKDDLDNMAWLAIRVLCDEEGQPMLTETDAQSVKQMPTRILKLIGDAVAEVSGLAGTEKKEEPTT